MSKKNTVYFTGRKETTLAITADHKKSGKTVVRVYPILHHAKSRKPIPFTDYNKKDAINTFEFENAEAIGNFVNFLTKAREKAIYLAGRRAVKDELLDDAFKSLLDGSIPPAFVVQSGIGLESMPDDVLARFAGVVHDEIVRRDPDNNKSEQNGQKKETEVVNQQ